MTENGTLRSEKYVAIMGSGLLNSFGYQEKTLYFSTIANPGFFSISDPV